MPNRQIENAGMTARIPRPRLRNVAIAVAIDEKVHHRAFDQQFAESDLPAEHGLDLQPDRELVNLQKGRRFGLLFAVNDDAIEMRSQTPELEVERANLRASAGRMVDLFDDFAHRELLEAA